MSSTRVSKPAVACLLLGAMTLVPIWAVEYLPLLDWPQHVASVSVLAHLHDPDWEFAPYYVHAPQLTTYLGFYYGGALLAQLMSADAALRVLLSAYFVGTPLSLMYLLRALDRPRWTALLIGPALFSWSFYMGFGAFLLSIPLMLVSLALVIECCERMTLRRGLWLAFTSTLLFLTHALGYGLMLLVGGLYTAVFHLLHVKRWAKVVLALSPSFACFGIWFRNQFIAQHAETLGAAAALIHAPSSEDDRREAVRYHPFEQKLDEIGKWFNSAFRGDEDTRIFHLWLWLVGSALVLTYVVTIWRGARGFKLNPRGLLVGLVLLNLYWLAPMEANNIWAISPRMILLGACGLVVLIPHLFERQWLYALIAVPSLLLTGYASFLNLTAFIVFEQEATGFREVLHHAEPGKRLYGLVYRSGSVVMSGPAYLHFPAYYMAELGGLTGFTFVNSPTLPLRLRTVGSSPYPGRRGEWAPHRVRYDLYSPYYDYFLSYGRTPTLAALRAPPGALELVAREGDWSLYRDTAPPRQLAYSFRERIHRAQVQQGGPCAAWNGQRFECPHRPWGWVGPGEEPLGGVPTPCIWAHPVGGIPTEIVFEKVPADATSLFGFHGVADTGQRVPDAGDVQLRIEVDGREVATLQAGDQPGYVTFDIPLTPTKEPRRVRFEIRADDDRGRHYCFDASLFD